MTGPGHERPTIADLMSATTPPVFYIWLEEHPDPGKRKWTHKALIAVSACPGEVSEWQLIYQALCEGQYVIEGGYSSPCCPGRRFAPECVAYGTGAAAGWPETVFQVWPEPLFPGCARLVR